MKDGLFLLIFLEYIDPKTHAKGEKITRRKEIKSISSFSIPEVLSMSKTIPKKPTIIPIISLKRGFSYL